MTNPPNPEQILLAVFSDLREDEFTVTSPPDPDYNCIAWAAGDTSHWWWPVRPGSGHYYFWPPEAPLSETLDAFVAAFRLEGYEVCEDGSLVDGIEKIALYTRADGVPAHAARQLPGGSWTSKCGRFWDIEHFRAEAVETDFADGYGAVATYMSRPTEGAERPA